MVGGVLVVEEFNWRSISTSMPLLRLVTSGVKGAIVKVHRRCRYTTVYSRALFIMFGSCVFLKMFEGKNLCL